MWPNLIIHVSFYKQTLRFGITFRDCESREFSILPPARHDHLYCVSL